MLVAINSLTDIDVQATVMHQLQKYYDEIRALLPSLPSTMQRYFDNFCILEQYGTGGFAYDKDIITIAYNETFLDKALQDKSLRWALFHESYHIAQGYHSQMGPILPIEETVYEGAATVFERDYAGGEVPYGDYSQAPVAQWVRSIKGLDENFDRDRWKYWDKNDQISWKLYKAGTYIVDEVIVRSRKSIIDLNSMSVSDILKLYQR